MCHLNSPCSLQSLVSGIDQGIAATWTGWLRLQKRSACAPPNRVLASFSESAGIFLSLVLLLYGSLALCFSVFDWMHNGDISQTFRESWVCCCGRTLFVLILFVSSCVRLSHSHTPAEVLSWLLPAVQRAGSRVALAFEVLVQSCHLPSVLQQVCYGILVSDKGSDWFYCQAGCGDGIMRAGVRRVCRGVCAPACGHGCGF